MIAIKEDRKIFSRTEKHLRRDVWNAWQEYNLIENGDKVMVCLSGGKDSYTMLDMLLQFLFLDVPQLLDRKELLRSQYQLLDRILYCYY